MKMKLLKVKVADADRFGAEFPQGVNQVVCEESFTATWGNSIGGERVTNEKKFVKGKTYPASSWRPEGMMIDSFFVFHRNAKNFSQA